MQIVAQVSRRLSCRSSRRLEFSSLQRRSQLSQDSGGGVRVAKFRASSSDQRALAHNIEKIIALGQSSKSSYKMHKQDYHLQRKQSLKQILHQVAISPNLKKQVNDRDRRGFALTVSA